MRLSKFHIIAPILFILSLAPSQAEVIYSDPLGLVETTIPANSDGMISPALHRSAAFKGSIASIDDADSISLTGASFTVNEYAGGGYALYVTNGDREGLWAVVDSNDADTINMTFVTQDLGSEVDDRVQVGDSVSIIPFWTPATLLPSTTTPDGTELLLFPNNLPGVNISAIATYTFFDGFGWYNGPTEVNDTPIYPDESLVVRNNSNDPIAVRQSGNVPMSAHRTMISQLSPDVAQDIRLATGLPVAVTMQEFVDGGVATDGDQILVFNQNMSGINKSAVMTATYFNGFGWYNGPTEVNNYLLEPGEGFVYRKASSNSTDIVVQIKPSFQLP